MNQPGVRSRVKRAGPALRSFLGVLVAVLVAGPAHGVAAASLRDTFPDTWVATDALGRRLPTSREAGFPRADRTVGLFYFLWLGPHAQPGAPWDVSRILAQDPGAMEKPNSPLWGPLHAAHHWGEPVFGYYQTSDPYVLRKHAQMLGDAGVDVVLFDVTNQLTYRTNYLALLETWSRVRAEGGRTPQVAFLCPFWEPAKVVRELFVELYEPGLRPELWFRWEGKPLILADPGRLGELMTFGRQDQPVLLEPGSALGQSFVAQRPFDAVGGCFPTWRSRESGCTLVLRREGPEGEELARQRFAGVEDNGWLLLRARDPWPPGRYFLEAREPAGRIGWWSVAGGEAVAEGEAFVGNQRVAGDRTLRLRWVDEAWGRIREFFTFRSPQPDYFRGQTQADMWSWLEVHPQHVFTNAAGQKEQMSVGVAQNAVSGRLGSMSEPGAHGRSFHRGATDRRPDAVRYGFNLAEQFERALAEDPRFLFVTGWNEWIAGRFNEFNGVRRPVMFVDQFDHEHSRDIEPMRGGHGDDYYYQFTALVRRYKGVRPLPLAGPARTIRRGEPVEAWASVLPEFRDDAGDTFHRDFPGYAGHTNYVNRSGRNDLVELRVSRDRRTIWFLSRLAEPPAEPDGMRGLWLLVDVDCDQTTGWEGYDFIFNREGDGRGRVSVERNTGGWTWVTVGDAVAEVRGGDVIWSVPRGVLGLEARKGPLRFDFKWAERVPAGGSMVEWLNGGDLAPNGRFNYAFRERADR